jgi:cytoskeletal protein RodZ
MGERNHKNKKQKKKKEKKKELLFGLSWHSVCIVASPLASLIILHQFQVAS